MQQLNIKFFKNEIRDCPGKFGTYSHRTYITTQWMRYKFQQGLP